MVRPKISIVILGYNRKDDLAVVLNHLREQGDANVETIIVDNASSDGSPEMIEKEFPEVVLIRQGKNYGISSYSKGFEKARGEIIVTLNNDSYPASDTLQKILDIFSADKDLGILQGRIINALNNTLFYPTDENDRKENEVYDFVVAGAAIRKDVFDKTGYFPQSVFLFGAEHDFSLRAISTGYKIKYCDNVVFYHLHRQEYIPSLFDPTPYHVQSYYWLIWRRYPLLRAIDATMGLFLVLLRKAKREKKLYVYFKATLAAVAGIPVIMKERRPVDYRYIELRERQFGTLSFIKQF